MRSLLLFILIVVTSGIVSAQKFEIGISAGREYKKIKSKQSDIMPGPNLQGNFPLYVVKAMYAYRKWQFGTSVGYCRNSYSNTIDPDLYVGTNPPVFTYRTTEEEIPVKLFTNRKIVFKHFETYAGAFIAKTFEQDRAVIESTNALLEANKQTWLSAGLQAGCGYFITKHIGISAEVSAEYSDHSPYYKSYYFPVTIGVSYRFW